MTTDQTMRALADAATQGPWGLNSAERASYSEIDKTDCRCSDPNDGEYIFDRLEEEKGHWHRYQDLHHVYGPMNVVIAGNYEYEDGGIIEHQDAEFIAACREWVPDAIRRIEAVREIHQPIKALNTRYQGGKLTQVCTGCGQDNGNWNQWPCPTIRALDGDK